MTRSRLIMLAGLLLASHAAVADILGSIRGVVHDPQHRPFDHATVTLHSRSSDWVATTNTDAAGPFTFGAVPLGEYNVTVASPGLVEGAQAVIVQSGSGPVLHYQLKIAAGKESVTVSAEPEAAPSDSATPATLVSRADVARTPDASHTNNLAIITD